MIFSVFGLRLKCPGLLLSSTGFKTPGSLVRQCEAAGLVFLSQRAHTFPFAIWLVLHRWNKWPFTFHLLVNQPLGINIKMTPTTSFVQGNTETKRALQSGILWLDWFSICSTIKKVCVAFLDYSLFTCLPYQKIMNPYLGSIRFIARGQSERDQSGSYGLLEL